MNNPKITITPMVGWEWAKRLLLKTKNLRPKTPLPTKEQKLQWLIAEHSPIKVVQWCVDMDDLRQWVGVHFLRHPHLLAYIATQRGDLALDPNAEAERVLSIIKEDIVNDPSFDRSEYRDYRLQGSPNNHAFVINAQTFINISRKRMCSCASKETRIAWRMVVDALREQDEEMARVLVPNCIYRGFCPEMECCGRVLSARYQEELKEYHNLIPSAEERYKLYCEKRKKNG